MGFSFKQFHVDDTGCGMPVSTDGVLLGAWAPLQQAEKILDIGAGSGLLSLMAAQRSKAQIDAVELDAQAATVCLKNFAASPWYERLQLHHCSIQQFSPPTSYDHILCNPPYFENGPHASLPGRASARHTDYLSYAELAAALARLLQPQGVASLILPWHNVPSLRRQLQQVGLHLLQQLDVSGRPGKVPNRSLLLVSKHCSNTAPLMSPIWVRDSDGRYSTAMRQLTQDFYLKL